MEKKLLDYFRFEIENLLFFYIELKRFGYKTNTKLRIHTYVTTCNVYMLMELNQLAWQLCHKPSIPL